jgi:uncharacterized protein (TIGR02391 family)
LARVPPDPPVRPREFRTVDEIDRAIKKLERRIKDIEGLDVRSAVESDSGQDDVVESDVRETIREVFGTDSPEHREHQYIRVWAGAMGIGMSKQAIIDAKERGKGQVATILRGLVARLAEKREELVDDTSPNPTRYINQLGLHPRISGVTEELFRDGHYWEAVFAGAKALVNLVKEKSGKHELDGATLMRTVFSKQKPMLVINALANTTDEDEQEGMMHLFEGAVLAIRNPGGHAFPNGTPQRALEYIQLLSLLAYQVDESRKA